MVITPKNDLLSEGMRALKEGSINAPGEKARNGRDIFAGLFQDVLRSTEKGGARRDIFLAQPALPKDQIRKLIMKIQVQMYEHLLGAMREGSEDESGLLAEGGDSISSELFPPRYVSSKNRQEPLKNGGSQTEKDFASLIEKASRTYGVDGALIRGVIRAESNFNPHAVSSKGAVGLMQLMPATARDLGVADPYNPAENVMAGTRYLKGLLDRYDGDVSLALAAYNWGMGNVEKSPDRLPVETRNYIARVSRYSRTPGA